MKFALSILLILGLWSCSDTKRPGYIEDLHTSEASLDGMLTTIDGIDWGKVQEAMDGSGQLGERIAQLTYDTLAFELAVNVDRFTRLKGDLTHSKELVSWIQSEIKSEKDIIVQLLNDVESDSGQRDRYDEYISFEKDKIEELDLRLSEVVSQIENDLNTFSELDMRMSSLLMNENL